MMRLPRELMLAAPTAYGRLPDGWAAEPKWDGFRALLAREAGGKIDGGEGGNDGGGNDGGDPARVRLVSRRGTDLTGAFPELAEAAAGLPAELGDVAFDGELVIWDEGRLEFKLLLKRLSKRQSAILAQVARHPAHFIAFDLLSRDGRDLIREPYRVRRAELERVFAEFALAPPWTLCPSTTDPDEAALWLRTWTAFGVEGLCFKEVDGAYRPGRRDWRKYRLRDSLEVVVGAISGTVKHPNTLICGVPGPDGLRFVGRTTLLQPSAATEIGADLAPAAPDHPWRGRQLTAAFEPGAANPVTLVAPTVVVEVSASVATDATGRWRQAARLLRARPDLTPAELPAPADG